MTVEVRAISQAELWDLVGGGIWHNLSVDEKFSLRRCLSLTTEMWAGLVDGDVIGVFGVCPQTLTSNAAYLWLWHTTKIKDHEFVFVRRSQMIVQALLEKFPVLYGLCAADARQSIRWIKWLGAEFEPPREGYARFEIKAA